MQGESRHDYDREFLVNDILFRKVESGWSKYSPCTRSCNFDRTGQRLPSLSNLRFFEAKFNTSPHEHMSYEAHELPGLDEKDERAYLLSWKIYSASCPRSDKILANNIGFVKGDEARIEKVVLDLAEEARDAIICRELRCTPTYLTEVKLINNLGRTK
jgi:hypothetical protein